jgi:hypothetical protein
MMSAFYLTLLVLFVLGVAEVRDFILRHLTYTSNYLAATGADRRRAEPVCSDRVVAGAGRRDADAIRTAPRDKTLEARAAPP